MMKTKIATVVLIGWTILCGCRSPEPQNKVQRIAGVLSHYPSDVKSAEAWYGHNFMVDGTPIQPTDAVPETVLLKHVGKRIRISGYWNPGTVWKPTPEEMTEQMPCDPNDDIPDIVNDGIMVQSIEILNEK